MKKLITILCVTFLLVGCGGIGGGIGRETNDFKLMGKLESFGSNKNILKDKDTGCLYLESTYNFTPYYGKDGNVKGCGDTE